MEKRHCLECGDTFAGRRDKKFCCDQCRTAYFNKQNTDQTNFMRNINNILRKNRRILSQLNPYGKVTVSKGELLDEGFKFSYFTNEFRTQSGNVYRFCYEQGYLQLENGLITLVLRKEYVDK
jgi:hypothetical protein